MKVNNCILCDGSNLTKILDLGDIPLPNELPLLSDPPDELFPLNVVFCNGCKLVQLGDIVSPERMFQNYRYVPSTSQVLVNHFKESAHIIFQKLNLNSDSIVVDIGSNDGLFLSFMKELGTKVLGIDPAKDISQMARDNGINTVTDFFGEDLGDQLRDSADVITANNCLAHQSNLKGFLIGVEKMLKRYGTFVAEFPYVGYLNRFSEFDTIYHEHQSYFSLAPLYDYLPKFGLHLNHVNMMPDVHGGSVRIWVSKRNWVSDGLTDILADETEMTIDSFSGFQQKVDEIRDNFISNILGLNNVYGIGASAKASIFLNYAKVHLEAVADANPMKQGRCIPGVRTNIIPEERLLDFPVENLVVLAWNLMDDMKRKASLYAPKANLIVPIEARRAEIGS